MKREEVANHLKTFDPEIYGLLEEERQRQRYTLSLMPNMNAMSPFAKYLEGSVLTNSFFDRHDETTSGGLHLDAIVRARAVELFHCDHAIVRLGNIVAASRVVFQALLESGDTVLSFNLRKKDHVAGLSYDFENYGIEPGTQEIDWGAVREQAERVKPRLIIFSPVSYPRTIDYQILYEIAQTVDAYLWVDISQSVGLVAAKLVPSPVPLADVVTFSTRDSLRGPDGAVLLTKRDIAARMDAAVINTGHEALHMNHLAALGVVLREAGSDRYRSYAAQVVQNAQVLARTLADHGASVLCGGTDTHLVLASAAAGIDTAAAVKAIGQMGIRVKTDNVPTMNSGLFLHALRLSTSNPTTRGMREEDIAYIGSLLAKPLTTVLSPEEIEKTRQEIVALVKDAPVFSEEWMGDSEG
ncbi:glycine hydroxymethyltransferase [Selenomonas sp. oral taxon 138]|uniref:glycine hydroxymethyltransferase n=1 Tax=Selenomonas sp. oral taxon 138 TaxID=712532 RepID=UPI0002A4038C|nr:glycine hydroxymethyltransferase [Selenomonas sp. oral taxon 138]EKX98091.1 glycine hydroxymethyltransferase [Selenomonas sp. oral taxon 138 str. F0429]